MKRSSEVRKLQAQERAGFDAGELANAHQQAFRTGRDMTEWMPKGQEATNPMVCSDEACGWSGFDAVEIEGETVCPLCGSEAW
jgi:hypothetical protein